MTLDEFVAESLRLCRLKRYNSTAFEDMRERLGLVPAIVRSVETSDPRSGYLQMCKLGLKDWTLEAAVVKFPEVFKDPKTQHYARARLDGLFDEM